MAWELLRALSSSWERLDGELSRQSSMGDVWKARRELPSGAFRDFSRKAIIGIFPVHGSLWSGVVVAIFQWVWKLRRGISSGTVMEDSPASCSGTFPAHLHLWRGNVMAFFPWRLLDNV